MQIDPSGFTAALGAANHLNTANDVIARQGWGTETLLTCFLVFIVFAATDAQRAVSTAHLPVSVRVGCCGQSKGVAFSNDDTHKAGLKA